MRLGGVTAVALAALAVAAGATVGLTAEPALVPPEAHTSADTRELARAYAGELTGLESGLARCSPAVTVYRHGIAFRHPRGTGGPPSLTLWVWLEPPEPLRGTTLPARATEAFTRYGHALFGRLLARSPVFADGRVAGYGLVLTWLGPSQRAGRLVGESLAVFADKLTVANFVHGTIGAATFLGRAGVRAFDGETELPAPALAADDGAAPAALAC